MPTVAEYLAQAQRNERFALAAAAYAERFTEWEATALFYAALHYANALLLAQGFAPANHRERATLLARLTAAGGAYRSLFQASLGARYELRRFTPEEIDRLRIGPFQQVKTEMLQRLAL